MRKKKCLISTEFSVLFPDAPRTSHFVNKLYNKPVMRRGKRIGKIVNIEPKEGENDWLILMEVEEDSVNDTKENEKASYELRSEQEYSGSAESDVKEN